MELTDVKHIHGRDGDDIIYGSDNANEITGDKGDDRLYGQGGMISYLAVMMMINYWVVSVMTY